MISAFCSNNNNERFSRIGQVAPMCTQSSTPIGIRTVPVLPLLSRFESIDRLICPGKNHEKVTLPTITSPECQCAADL